MELKRRPISRASTSWLHDRGVLEEVELPRRRSISPIAIGIPRRDHLRACPQPPNVDSVSQRSQIVHEDVSQNSEPQDEFCGGVGVRSALEIQLSFR